MAVQTVQNRGPVYGCWLVDEPEELRGTFDIVPVHVVFPAIAVAILVFSNLIAASDIQICSTAVTVIVACAGSVAYIAPCIKGPDIADHHLSGGWIVATLDFSLP